MDLSRDSLAVLASRLGSGALTANLIAGGRSNLTYVLTDGTQRWVLRRPPAGHVLETAHDMDREVRVQQALAATAVPVPRILLSEGPELLGAPFYVMGFVDGLVPRSADDLASVSPGPVTDALVDALAALHAVDPASVGLGELGRPDGFLERQVRRWLRQLDSSRSRDVAALDDLGALLGTSVPPSARSGIVHGDYRLDNVVLAGTEVVAVLDWEMATLGDPLTDLASLVVWWDELAGLDSPVAAVPVEHGFPGRDALLERYVAASGADLTDLDWYLAFALFKISAIFEQIHYRTSLGMTPGGDFTRIGDLVLPLAERGLATLSAR